MKYQVVESITINSAIQAVKDQVFDLREWESWSPWLCLEPLAQTTNHKEGVHLEDYLFWSGNVIGEGEMQVQSRTNDHLVCQLRFLKPWKSKAMTTITLTQQGDSTKVTWTMDAGLPFYLFFMKTMMKTMISKDYKRGLLRLKNLVELGEVPAKLEFVKDVTKNDAFYFVGKRNSCLYKDLEETMVKDYETVSELLEKNAADARAVCLYHKVDMVKDLFDYSIGFAFDEKPTFAIGDLERLSLPEHTALQANLEGSYDFLADAWTGIMMHQKARKLKSFNKVPPYEEYVKDPTNTTDPKAYFTKIFVPVKS